MLYISSVFNFLSLLFSVCSENEWHVGVIYDDGFDQANYNLAGLFLALKPTLEHYADISTRNSTLPRPQNFKFTVEKFFINQCKFKNFKI
ncbi:glutamate receptor [Schistosoma japonicum]|nr:glutamate receptor [Schistosoma japonicum]